MKNNRYAPPIKLRDLTNSERRVWCYFLTAQEDNLVLQTQALIASELSLSVTTVSRATRKFTKLGMIKKVKTIQGWIVPSIKNHAAKKGQRITSTGTILKAV